MLDSYLNQEVEYTQAARNPDGTVQMSNRGEVVYLAPVVIPCRKQRREREILTADAQIIKTDYVFYTEQQVQTDDLLDGRRVQNVSEWVDLGGDIVGYKAVV